MILEDRLFQIALSIGGSTENAGLVNLANQQQAMRSQDFLNMLSQNILTIDKLFSNHPKIANRFYNSFTQGPISDKKPAVHNLIETMTSYKDRVQNEKLELRNKSIALQKEEKSLDPAELNELHSLELKEDRLLQAITIIKKNENAMAAANDPWGAGAVNYIIDHYKERDGVQTIDVNNNNPIIEKIIFNTLFLSRIK